MIPKPTLAAAIVMGLAAPSAVVAEVACYDAKVRARATDQIPSEIPGCGVDCIIVSWPWFVDLRVKRIIDGALSAKRVRVLTVQHTYHVARETTWLLRRNAAGGFNALSEEDGAPLARCPTEVAPVEPHIRPSDGQTLDDLRDTGIRLFGRHAK